MKNVTHTIHKGPPVYRPVPSAGQPKSIFTNERTGSVLPPPIYRPQAKSSGNLLIQPKAPQTSSSYRIQQMPQIHGRQQIKLVGAGGVVAGSVDLELRSNSAARLTNLVVGESHRNQGLGSKLVQSALQAARSKGISNVQLEAKPESSSIPTHALAALYGKAGFRTIARTPVGNPIMLAGHSSSQTSPTILRKAVLANPLAVVQRAWSQPLFKSTAATKTLTDDDFPSLTPSAPKSSAPISISVPTDFSKWAAKPVVSTPSAPVDALAGIKGKILSWDRTSHEGVKMALTETQIKELSDWAEAVKSKSGSSYVFNVLRGEGSGDYSGKDQLKIIAIFGPTLSGSKKPTYHITIKE